MMDEVVIQSLISAASALAGAAVGGGATYVIQERRWRLDVRSNSSAEFVQASAAWLDALDRLSFAVEKDLQRERRWDDANTSRTNAVAARGRVQMLGRAAVLEAALDVEGYLRQCHDEIFDRDQHGDRRERSIIRGVFDSKLAAFMDAANRDLGL